MTDTTLLEEKLAHLEKTIDDLSEVVRHQGAEVERLTKLTSMLAGRLRDSADASTGGVFFADERPPHY